MSRNCIQLSGEQLERKRPSSESCDNQPKPKCASCSQTLNMVEDIVRKQKNIARCTQQSSSAAGLICITWEGVEI